MSNNFGFCFGVIIFLFLFLIVILGVKVILLRRAFREIMEEFEERIHKDTNTLISISSRDVYARALAANMNRQLRELRSKRHRFEQGDLEIREAVSNVAHDLRTPLTAICGYLDLLSESEHSDTAVRYLAVIRERTEAMKQMTEELFRYSVFMNTAQDAVYENLCLNSVLEESIMAYYTALQGCHITPEIVMTEKRIERRLNKNALSRILGNLIGNAIKYSDGDLRIELTERGEMVFSNHASRLDEVTVGKMFDRFYTVETAAKSTGLGLTIAKTLTEQMGGTISAVYSDHLLSIRLVFENMVCESEI